MKWIFDDEMVEKLYHASKIDQSKNLEKIFGEMYVTSASYCPVMCHSFFEQLTFKVYEQLEKQQYYITNLSKEDFVKEIIGKLELIKKSVDDSFDVIKNYPFNIDNGVIRSFNCSSYCDIYDKEQFFHLILSDLYPLCLNVKVYSRNNKLEVEVEKRRSNIPGKEEMVEIIKANKEYIFSRLNDGCYSEWANILLLLKKIENDISSFIDPSIFFDKLKDQEFKNKHDVIEFIKLLELKEDMKISLEDEDCQE